MNQARLLACLLASLPAGWFAGVLYERVPFRKGTKPRHLFKPFPKPHISGVFFTIHVFTTALFMIAALRFEREPIGVLAAYLVFFTAMVALSAIDLDTLRLPDRIVGGTLVVGIPLVVAVSAAAREVESVRYALLGGVFYFGFLLLTHLAFPRGMGFGDVKLAALMGMFVGWAAPGPLGAVNLVLLAMLVGFVGGSAVGVVLFAFRRNSRPYPFGPFLIAGAVVAIVFSQQLLPASSF